MQRRNVHPCNCTTYSVTALVEILLSGRKEDLTMQANDCTSNNRRILIINTVHYNGVLLYYKPIVLKVHPPIFWITASK